MMKKLLTAFICALFATSVFAFEWGGVIKNDTGVNASDSLSLNQSDSVFLWGSVPLKNDGSMYIKGEGMYKINLAKPLKPSGDIVFTQIADLDLLKFAGDFKTENGTLSISLGRFSFSDLTSSVFSQCSDGLFVKYSNQGFQVNGYAGYTGLLNSYVVQMINSPDYEQETPTDIYSLSAKYIPVALSVSFPALFANQALSAQAAGFIDLNGTSFNRFYGTLNLTGPLLSSLYYSATTCFGYTDKVSNMSSLTFTYFPLPATFLNVGAKFASWDNGSFGAFTGVTASPLFTGTETTSCIVPSVSITSVLMGKLILMAGGKTVLAHDGEKIGYAGLAGDASVMYNMFSDLQIGLSVAGNKVKNRENDDMTITFKASMSF